VLLRVGKGSDAKPVVALGLPESSRNQPDFAGTRQGILERELIRQALLIAARDELGIATRDELLDDQPPWKGEGPPMEVVLLFRGGECHALVRRGEGDKAEILLRKDLGTDPDRIKYVPELTVMAESLARTEFPALLKQLGLAGEPNRIRDDGAVPADVEQRLDQLGLVDHIAAVRSLHEAIRADGESPARLSALARAYAQLGVLCEYQWSPAHRAFKARAILYAERLLTRDPKSATALRTRAFVRALVGRHDLALADLDEANRIDAETKTVTPAPSWLPVIDAYLKSDRKRLAIKDGPHPRLAALLSMMVVEKPPGTRVLVQAARDVASLDADCGRAYDVICGNGQIGDLHVATQMGPDAFTKLFPIKLKSLKSLPDPVKKPLNQNRDELTLVGELDKAGLPGEDGGEPSWGVLAHLAREARFVHAWRRLFFMTGQWHVPAGEYFDDVRPFVEKHRFYPYLQYLALAPQEGIPALTTMADRMDLAEIETTELPMLQALNGLQHPVFRPAWNLAVLHSTNVAHDYAERLKHLDDHRAHFSHALLIISPYSAYAMATLVESDWDQVQGEVPAWREKVGDAPALIGALGKKYLELKRYDDAEKCLRRYMELSPDRWAYQSLASSYLGRNDRERWKATLDDFLTNTEPAGLEHAQVQVEIANYLMQNERWAEAKKYAEPAAETWAGWAMQCASRCNEGLPDWERAELWIRRTSERYPDTTWPDWYLFCKRTGHGDAEAARAFAEEFLAAVADRPDLVNPAAAAFFSWSKGEPKKALEYFEKVKDANYNQFLCRMLIADEIGDKGLRGRLLQEFCTKFEKQVPRIVALCKLIRDAHADGGDFPLDLTAVDGMIGRMPARTQGNAAFLIGRYLMNRGQSEPARKYLRLCAESPEPPIWLRTIAADSVRAPDAKKPR
jgi:tetratricopeptide (TPR) repeat protein